MRQFYSCIVSLLVMTGCASKEGFEASPLDLELEKSITFSAAGKGKTAYLLPESSDFVAIPQDPKNPITAEKVALGQMLFHETGLARKPQKNSGFLTYSCASCHHAKAGFQSCVPQGIGDGGVAFGKAGEQRNKNLSYLDSEMDVQPIRSPSSMNIAYQTNVLWNGQFGATHLNVGTQASWVKGTPKENNFLGFQGTETQAIAGQGVHRLEISKTLLERHNIYMDFFKKAFPNLNVDDPQQLKISGALAIAAYERTVLANEAPFQQWLRGNHSAMTNEQKQGAILFFGKAGCVKCHNGPSLADMNFYALGMKDLTNGSYGQNNVFEVKTTQPEHLGRGGFTGKAEDMFKFKVPQLYNLKDSPFYGHGASFYSIEAILEYKNNAKPQNQRVPNTQLAAEFKPLNLTAQELKHLTTFLKEGLYDPNLQRYVPKALPTGLAFPNNDPQSRKDLGF